jgi:membrane-associated phospholipid phosphatase
MVKRYPRAALVATATLFATMALYASTSCADGIDHKLAFDNSGIWKRSTQLLLVNGLVLGVSAGALWEGGESRLGRTYWQGVDSILAGAVASTALKEVVARPRPTQGGDGDEFRKGKGHYSFPSGEVTAVTAAITPFVLEYGREQPMAYALYALPAYDALARLKSQAHWQTDVIAGFALGAATGYLAHNRDSPFVLGILPGGFSVGLRTRF